MAKGYCPTCGEPREVNVKDGLYINRFKSRFSREKCNECKTSFFSVKLYLAENKTPNILKNILRTRRDKSVKLSENAQSGKSIDLFSTQFDRIETIRILEELTGKSKSDEMITGLEGIIKFQEKKIQTLKSMLKSFESLFQTEANKC